MHKAALYPRLASQSIRKNGRYYIPYFLTCTAAAAMFYIMFFLSGNEGIQALRGSAYVLSMLFLGTGIVGIFSAILIFYTNSFLMKRRKQELGLFHVLGMEKRHISLVLWWETVYTALLTIAAGLALGVLLSKLMLLLLCAILRETVPFGFFVSVPGLIWTAGVFAAIFLVCLLSNLRRIGKVKPIELLHSGGVSDREPKSRWLLAVIGLITLALGYGIAVAVKSPLSALGLFFVAVLLVIIGTFCLFIAGTITVLKLLRRNRRYYYQTRNFIAVSGMLHRMKRNAAGLAAICILCSMVLVTISTTVCLYLGTEDVLGMMYPRDFQVFLIESDQDSMHHMADILEEEAAKAGLELRDLAWTCYYPGDYEMGSKQLVGDKLRQYQDGQILGENGQDYRPTVFVGANIPGDHIPEAFTEAVEARFGEVSFEYGYTDLRETMAFEIYSMLGGFFFIGLLLGVLFLLATVLIIYYKQVSEGYEDIRGYQIMQQVGLSQAEVRGSIRRQIMTVFFLPLCVSAVHIAFAFNMMVRMLAIFSLTNVGLFALCCLGTFLAFAVIYILVYSFTAKAYYRIVRA